MTEKYDKLILLLKELFQLDQPDLDFGMYRIMHARSAEVTEFLTEDLLGYVKNAFMQYKSADREQTVKELDEALEDARRHFDNPNDSKAVKKLRSKLKQDVDTNTLENEVYDHLYSFFRRYYSKGDFLAKRVYKQGVYAIPYEGEEVLLHWANKDQYYIKTSEYLQNFTFRLKHDNEENPMRVHFRLTDAKECEHDNAEANERKNKVFILVSDEDSDYDFLEEVEGEEGKELIIRFEYRSATLGDWSRNQASKAGKPPNQAELISLAVERILATDDPALSHWIALLGSIHTKANGERANYSRLEAHLRRYTARNSFDYFIHKDLGGFLRRELDFYIKNEILYLDDVENEKVLRVEHYLAKIKVIRKIAGKVIDFLAQLEEFQKKLWLKKKFVTCTEYCLPIEDLPTDLHQEIEDEASIRDLWTELGLEGAVKMTHPVDTKMLSPNLRDRVIESIDHTGILGTLVIGDNRAALALCERHLKGRVRMVYMDPPFNTGNDGFAYKDHYMHSTWLSMMQDRIELLARTLTDDGTLYAHIDYDEKERLKLLLDQSLWYITEIIWRIGWLSGYKTVASKFIRNHDTIFQYGRTRKPFFKKMYIPYPEDYVRRDGKAPEGAGYPIEDTWNCSQMDSMDSIQIMSFSREKVGDDSLTQKNENLIKRMVQSSSERDDLIVDPFLGSGTTAAVAMKLQRRWFCCEVMDQALESALPRLRKVISGDQYGISKDEDVRWSGGSSFRYLEIESYEDTLNNLKPSTPPPTILFLTLTKGIHSGKSTPCTTCLTLKHETVSRSSTCKHSQTQQLTI